jgi:RNA polymerase sigma-70 factor (ECF subfamily)
MSQRSGRRLRRRSQAETCKHLGVPGTLSNVETDRAKQSGLRGILGGEPTQRHAKRDGDMTPSQGSSARPSYEELFQEEAPRLWRALYAYTGGRSALAEDAVAEAFTLAMERGEAVRDPMAWIFRTAFRLVRVETRREHRPPPQVEIPGAAVPPEELIDLLSALQGLPPNQRAALVLHYHVDLPVSEVGRILGITSSTVRVHLHRGRSRLRRLLDLEKGLNQ